MESNSRTPRFPQLPQIPILIEDTGLRRCRTSPFWNCVCAVTVYDVVCDCVWRSLWQYIFRQLVSMVWRCMQMSRSGKVTLTHTSASICVHSPTATSVPCMAKCLIAPTLRMGCRPVRWLTLHQVASMLQCSRDRACSSEVVLTEADTCTRRRREMRALHHHACMEIGWSQWMMARECIEGLAFVASCEV